MMQIDISAHPIESHSPVIHAQDRPNEPQPCDPPVNTGGGSEGGGTGTDRPGDGHGDGHGNGNGGKD